MGIRFYLLHPYYSTNDFGLFFSAFLAIPTTPFVLIFGGAFLEIVGGILSPLFRWLKR
jgi:hypothetical protein